MSDLASALAIGAEEQSLVADLKAGSESAFASLIAQYSRPVYSLIARSLRDPADAADVTQEVFVKVFRNIHNFHGDSSLRTWIYRIAVHEASNQRRWWTRHKRQEMTLDETRENEDGESLSLGETLATGDASPFENVARAQTRQQVEVALHGIPEVFRTALVLREIEGLSYDEIADILETNVGTIKSRLMRGRAALREALRQSHNSSSLHSRTPKSSNPKSGYQRAGTPRAPGISTKEGVVGS
jgi:RNA polymerase sigma-70 factor (ECF subfamily)